MGRKLSTGERSQFVQNQIERQNNRSENEAHDNTFKKGDVVIVDDPRCNRFDEYFVLDILPNRTVRIGSDNPQTSSIIVSLDAIVLAGGKYDI